MYSTNLYAIRTTKTKDIFKLCYNDDGYFWTNIETYFIPSEKYLTIKEAIFCLYNISSFFDLEHFKNDRVAMEYFEEID